MAQKRYIISIVFSYFLFVILISLYCVQGFTNIQAYPLCICHVDISSIFNKKLHCFQRVLFGCNVQGSPLMKRMKQI